MHMDRIKQPTSVIILSMVSKSLQDFIIFGNPYNAILTLVSTSVHSILLSGELLLVSLILELELWALGFLLASLIDLLGRGRGVCGLECFKTSTSVNWTAVPPPLVRKISP